MTIDDIVATVRKTQIGPTATFALCKKGYDESVELHGEFSSPGKVYAEVYAQLVVD